MANERLQYIVLEAVDTASLTLWHISALHNISAMEINRDHGLKSARKIGRIIP